MRSARFAAIGLTLPLFAACSFDSVGVRPQDGETPGQDGRDVAAPAVGGFVADADSSVPGDCSVRDSSTAETDGSVLAIDGSAPETDSSVPALDSSVPAFDGSTLEFDSSVPAFDGSVPDAGVPDDAGADAAAPSADAGPGLQGEYGEEPRATVDPNFTDIPLPVLCKSCSWRFTTDGDGLFVNGADLYRLALRTGTVSFAGSLFRPASFTAFSWLGVPYATVDGYDGRSTYGGLVDLRYGTKVVVPSTFANNPVVLGNQLYWVRGSAYVGNFGDDRHVAVTTAPALTTVDLPIRFATLAAAGNEVAIYGERAGVKELLLRAADGTTRSLGPLPCSNPSLAASNLRVFASCSAGAAATSHELHVFARDGLQPRRVLSIPGGASGIHSDADGLLLNTNRGLWRLRFADDSLTEIPVPLPAGYRNSSAVRAGNFVVSLITDGTAPRVIAQPL